MVRSRHFHVNSCWLMCCFAFSSRCAFDRMRFDFVKCAFGKSVCIYLWCRWRWPRSGGSVATSQFRFFYFYLRAVCFLFVFLSTEWNIVRRHGNGVILIFDYFLFLFLLHRITPRTEYGKNLNCSGCNKTEQITKSVRPSVWEIGSRKSKYELKV